MEVMIIGRRYERRWSNWFSILLIVIFIRGCYLQHNNFLSRSNKKLVIVSAVISVHASGKQRKIKATQVFIRLLRSLHLCYVLWKTHTHGLVYGLIDIFVLEIIFRLLLLNWFWKIVLFLKIILVYSFFYTWAFPDSIKYWRFGNIYRRGILNEDLNIWRSDKSRGFVKFISDKLFWFPHGVQNSRVKWIKNTLHKKWSFPLKVS